MPKVAVMEYSKDMFSDVMHAGMISNLYDLNIFQGHYNDYCYYGYRYMWKELKNITFKFYHRQDSLYEAASDNIRYNFTRT